MEKLDSHSMTEKTWHAWPILIFWCYSNSLAQRDIFLLTSRGMLLVALTLPLHFHSIYFLSPFSMTFTVKRNLPNRLSVLTQDVSYWRVQSKSVLRSLFLFVGALSMYFDKIVKEWYTLSFISIFCWFFKGLKYYILLNFRHIWWEM